MRYAEARNQIRSGDVLAWDGRCFQCRIVRAFTAETYSHVGVAWVVGGRVFILEAVTSGVRIFPLSRELPFYWLPLGLAWTVEAEQFALAHVGEKYSRWEAVKAFLRLPLDNTTWQCAEYALAVIERIGVRLDVPATPGAVVRALQRRGAEVILVEEE